MKNGIKISNGKFGLLGEKLGHSFSPLIHSRLCNYSYELFERAPEDVESFVKNGTLDGFNVTSPYKKNVFALCDRLSDTARKIGSVNTVVRASDGTIHGYNTDYFGFSYLLRKAGFDVTTGKTLVLGSGGASVTVCAVLRDLSAKEVVVISRSSDDNYANLYEKHADALYVVNTTPLGMYPKNGVSPVDLSRLPSCKGVIDLIYNPAKTQLLLDAEAAGITALNGLAMLTAQAKQSCELFIGEELPDTVIDEITREIEANTKNIILIGMPGCGKSTLGAHLSKLTGRPFIDIDNVIEKRIQMSICDFFSQNGEPAFRQIETEVLAEVSKLSGQIIATGGGIVTVPENLPLMKQNGTIVMLNRSVSELPVAGRPISMSCDLAQLAQKRLPIYNAWKDFSVESGPLEETASCILKQL